MEVVEPPALRERVLQVARDVVNLYSDRTEAAPVGETA
jgi:hypothetical protein